jgi:hypothetical protein
MKKILLYGGAFLGSFLVINVGMYFFLKSTQPKTAITALQEPSVVSDSTLAHSDVLQDSSLTATEPIAMAGVEAGPPVAEATTEALADAHITEPDPEIESPDIEPESELETELEPEAAVTPDEVAEVITGDPKQLAKLAKLMDGMKPVDAAAIASRLPVDVIVSLVMKMKDRNAAKMMASLPIEQAARVAMRMSELASGTARS